LKKLIKEANDMLEKVNAYLSSQGVVLPEASAAASPPPRRAARGKKPSPKKKK